MPQETNLNVAPYFDDYNPSDNYYKVLFKPGFPVQARELTGLQSILQNQVERFGNHIFKDGSSVTGGGLKYNNAYPVVRINVSYSGVAVTQYIDDLLEARVVGSKSGVRAKIKAYLNLNAFPGEPYTLFVEYLDPAIDGETAVFAPSETLLIERQISNQNVIIQEGEGVATTTASLPTSYGSGCVLSKGVYFVRGYFIDIPEQSIILEPYSTTPTYKIGLEVLEEIINSDIDDDLTDNASSFNNYTAPGADRLKIRAILTKKNVNSTQASNFIELMEVREGVIASQKINPEYNKLEEEFARRTYDESGDYYVIPFNVQPKETLNDYKGNKGIFNSDQLTYNNSVPAEHLATYKISPGKAYVKGYEVNIPTNQFLDFDKPRTSKLLKNQSLNYYTGPSFGLNRVNGSPKIGIGTDYTVSLRDARIGVTSTTAAGKEIGLARVYDFALESGSYDAVNPNVNTWDISLYDVQTYTNITANTAVTKTLPQHVKGKSSGATGYLRYDVNAGTAMTAYNVNGKFIQGEQLIFNGIEEGNVIGLTTSYSSSDIKSLYGTVGTANTFNADVKQSVHSTFGEVNITPASGGISTVTSTNATKFFTGITTVGNIVQYTNPGSTDPSYAKVATVSQHSLVLNAVTSVTGVNDGALPTAVINPSDFRILSSSYQFSSDNTLYTTLPKDKVSNVDLTNANLVIRKEFDVTITNGSSNSINSGSGNETFLPYDEENYCLVRTDGSTEALSADKFVFTNGSQTLTINGLDGLGPAKLIATLRKINVKEKVKTKQKINILSLDSSKYSSSGVGATTLNDGLTYGNIYGTRVQDEEISLGVPDATKIYGVFESSNANDVIFPRLALLSINSDTAKTGDLLDGEEFIGESSKFVGVYIGKVDDGTINYIALNNIEPLSGEVIKFKESGITATVSAITLGSPNITDEFDFDNGQRSTIYDYSRLVRKSGYKEPSKKIKVVFESAYFLTSDVGDITTVNSYGDFSYCSLPKVNGTKVCEIIDIRPRVSDFSGTTRSPFEFLGRVFTQDGNSSTNILASDKSFIIDYSFYLPRRDKIFLTKDGTFQLVKGIPAETPELPNNINDALEIASATLPAYLCNVSEINLNLSEHKRYRMRDIRNLERRIKNLEFYTSLSLLESNTVNLQIQDTDGLNRFKSGFFVDDFSNTRTQLKKTLIKNSIDVKNSELRPAPYTTELDLVLSPLTNGIRRSNRVLSLNYNEMVAVSQPYASRVENVTPYLVNYYSGTVQLTPSSDVWADVVMLEAREVEDETYSFSNTQVSDDGRSGFSPVTWGSWSEIWTGADADTDVNTVDLGYGQEETTITLTSTPTGVKSRTGTQTLVKETFNSVSQGNKVVSTALIPYMRSRNIRFRAAKMKPMTRLYVFFDSEDLTSYVVPKLLQIQMVSGTFEKGEVVKGTTSSGEDLITFKINQQNHKHGNGVAPSDTYILSPYDRSITIPEDYSSTSTILNVDTLGLAEKAKGQYHGYVTTGLRLVGQTSNAEATVSEVKLFSDTIGSVMGSVYIPDPSETANPAFETGMKVFRLTSNKNNSQIAGNVLTDATTEFESQGTLSKEQETILTTKNIHTQTNTQVESHAIRGSQTSTTSSSTSTIDIGGNYTPGDVVVKGVTDLDWDDQILLDDNGNPVYNDETGEVTVVDGGGAQIVITYADTSDTIVAGQSNNVSVVQQISTNYDQDADANTGVSVYSPITPSELAHYDYSSATNPNNPTLEVNDGVATMVQQDIASGANTSAPTQEDQISDIVGGFYVKHLGRIPDSQGQAYWEEDIANQIASGKSLDDAISVIENAFATHPDVVSTGTVASAAAGLPTGTTISSLVVADSALIQYGGPSGINYTDSAISGEYTGSTDWDSAEIQNKSTYNQIKNQVIGATATYNSTTGQLEMADIDDALNAALNDVTSGAVSMDDAVASLIGLSKEEGNSVKAAICGDDPLAQSFFVNQPEGIFVTSIDIFFGSKDETLPVVVQLRPMQLGLPTEQIYPFSEVVIDPQYVYVSEDASVATRVTFDGPVYLAGGEYHSVVLLSSSNNYTAWISRMGETDITSATNPELDEIVISEQPLLGSLFKSQNGSTWNPSQYEDLKFTLFKAVFSEFSGSINFTNPELNVGTEQIPALNPNAFEIDSNRIRVGLGTTVVQDDLTLGNTISQLGSNATGNYVGSAGSAFGSMTITNSGIGYTGNQTYNGVSLTNITGTGSNATANISIQNGVAIAATIGAGGTGYSIGDVVTPTQIGGNKLGTNMRLSIGDLRGVNELIIDNVQGSFVAGVGKTIQFVNNAGVTSSLNSGIGGNVLLSAAPTVVTDGLHIKVNQNNHGMYSTQNTVTINNAKSDVALTKLSADYSNSDTGTITVDDASAFGTFEGVGVGTTTPGYARIGKEIFAYEGATATTLTGITTRGVDGTLSVNHYSGDTVEKYELNGISLRRINTNHNLADATVTDPIGLDYYTIKIDTSKNGVDRSASASLPQLHFNETKSTGGTGILPTENVPFEIVTPIVENITPVGTNLTAKIRTVSGNSVDGTEVPFQDQGFEDISLISDNYMDSPRIVASRINETTSLAGLPKNKSFTLSLDMTTNNPNLSPIVDLDRIAVILTSNRVDNPITDYSSDPRTSTVIDDPNSFVYASKPVTLETPATSIKIYMTGHINVFSDIRAFYAISNDPEQELIYNPFPGYTNLLPSGEIIDPAKNNGLPDKSLPKTDILAYTSSQVVYKDYEYTIDSLPSFRYFSIKLVGTSTNAAQPPRVKDLRVISLA
mgnify:CR=1 FL=1